MQCFKCGRFGHAAAECPQQSKTSPSTSPKRAKTDSSTKTSGQAFIVRDLAQAPPPPISEAGWFGMQDGGASSLVCGHSVLMEIIVHMHSKGVPVERYVFYPSSKLFGFGGDAMRRAEWTVKLPIYVNGRSGLVECFVVDGSTPMLVGRPILKALKIKVDWENDLYSFDNGPWQPATLGQKGEFLIKFDDGVTADSEGKEVQFDLVTAETFDLVTDQSQGHSNGYTLQQYLDATGRDPPELALRVADDENYEAESNVTTSDLFDPDDEQETLVRRNITEKLMKGMRFHHAQQLAHRRQVLEHGLRAQEAGQKIFWEVYSGCGLLSQEMARRGYKVFSFDYNTGWDFDKPSHRNEYFKLLDEVAPDFVWIAPSCKKWSHMQSINLKTEQQRFALQCERDYNEAVHLKLSRRTYDTQHREGRDSGIEHPKLSEAWNTKTWQDLPGYACHLDQCAFDAMIADYYIKKPTRLQLTNQQKISPGHALAITNTYSLKVAFLASAH